MSNIDERLEKLRERSETKPQSWRFDDNGREFAGTFQGWTSARAEWSGTVSQVPIALFIGAADNAEWSIWCFHRVLLGQLVKADPQNGELVLIRHLGTVEPDGGGPAYENYRVTVERAPGSRAGLSIRDVAALGGVESELPPEPRYATNQLKPAEHEEAMAQYAPPPGDDDIPF